MVTIVFETHSTTPDNQAHRASGWNDVDLSELGVRQARELGGRYSNVWFDAIFCSDLRRSYRTAEIAFGGKFPLIRDARLRECNYGDYTGGPSSQIERQRHERISVPFPNGESYRQTSERVREFLSELPAKYDGGRVMVIGHRATRYALEHWAGKLPLEQVIRSVWKWRPGWEYRLEAADIQPPAPEDTRLRRPCIRSPSPSARR